jgi:hypothetical protein
MPKGVETYVENGFATIEFVDPSLRGPGLQRLLDIGGPETIDTITRDGPRRKYRTPAGNAAEAGLLDTATPALVPASQTAAEPINYTSAAKQLQDVMARVAQTAYEPTLDWSFASLKAHAVSVGKDPSALRSKADVLDLINEETKR